MGTSWYGQIVAFYSMVINTRNFIYNTMAFYGSDGPWIVGME